MNRFFSLRQLAFLPVFALSLSIAEEPILEKGDRLAIVGDSITEQKLYSKFIETYLQVCHPDLEIHCFQFGWGGERAPGFAARMENDLLPWDPDVVTTCYGMNDGTYRAYTEEIGKRYEEGMQTIIERLTAAGATLIVGSPGVVDSFTWKREDPEFDQVYNQNLEQLGKIASELAEKHEQYYADVFGTMMKSMVSAKSAFGQGYPVAGNDGVHPGANGHLIMAYAFLKALDLDGTIGTIEVDLSDGKATASDGHRIVSSQGGELQVESSRYPFCFTGDEVSPRGTRSILAHVPFNEDLNRFILKVKNLASPEAEVTFGAETQTFSKAELEEGINLAAEFFENPFVGAFNEVENAVAQKQAFETYMIKSLITNFRSFEAIRDEDEEFANALDVIQRKMIQKNGELQSAVREKVVPVSYTIKVVPHSN